MDRADIDYIKPIRTFLLHWLNDQQGNAVKVVQVGANDGSMADPLSPVIGRFGWEGLLIEPVPGYFKALCAKYEGNDRVQPKNFAIALEEGTLEIFHIDPAKEADYPGWARGLASFERKHVERAVKPEDITSVTVPCYPLHDIVTQAKFETADILVVDVEGAEKLVFSSFNFKDFRPRMIEVETRHLPADTKTWLFKRFHHGGYDVFDFGYDTIAIRRGWLPSSLRHIFGLTKLYDFKVAPEPK